MSSYRYMRVLLFFDLPTLTSAERKAAASFRKSLVKDGFLMLQESVYCKLALNGTAVALIKNRVAKYLPDKGSVCYTFPYGKPESQKAAYPPFLGGTPPPDQRRKEGVANVCYIR